MALYYLCSATKTPATQSATSTQPAANASLSQKLAMHWLQSDHIKHPPELDIDSFVTGVRAGHAGTEPAYTEELQKAYTSSSRNATSCKAIGKQKARR